MKYRVFAVILPLLVVLLSLAAQAEITPVIQDDAELLSSQEEEQLYRDMLPVCEYGTPLFWTTTEDGDYVEQARTFYHERIGTESGTLFMINMKTRYLTVFSDGDNYLVITDSEGDTITDNVYRIAGRGEYYECAASVFRQVYRLLHGERISRPMKLVSNLLLSAAFALLLACLYIGWRYEQHSRQGAPVPIPVTALDADSCRVHTKDQNSYLENTTRIDLSSDSSSSGRDRSSYRSSDRSYSSGRSYSSSRSSSYSGGSRSSSSGSSRSSSSRSGGGGGHRF